MHSKSFALLSRDTRVAPRNIMAATTLLLVGAIGWLGNLSAQAQDHSPVLLVVNKGESTLAVVNPDTYEILARIPTARDPHEVAASADGRFAYVSGYGTDRHPGHALSIINIPERIEDRRIDLGALLRPHGITEAGGDIYFTIEGSRAVARYNPKLHKVDWILGTGQAKSHMVVASTNLDKIYTANINSNTVTSIHPGPTPSQTVEKQIPVGDGPEGMDLSPNQQELWVATQRDGNVSIIDTASDTVKDIFHVGGFPIRLKFTPDGKRVLISALRQGDLVVVKASNHEIEKRIHVGAAPVGILVTPDGKRAFVAATADNRVVAVDLKTLETLKSFEPGRDPDGMAWAAPE